MFALVARLSERSGLTTADPRDANGRNAEQWRACWGRETVRLCGKTSGSNVTFEMRQALATRFSPWAESLRRELVDSLRADYGAASVR